MRNCGQLGAARSGNRHDYRLGSLLNTRLHSPFHLSQILATFTHSSDDVWSYVFANGDTITCTASHPIFSIDRNAYIAVGELQSGEQVMTAGEKVVKFIA